MAQCVSERGGITRVLAATSGKKICKGLDLPLRGEKAPVRMGHMLITPAPLERRDEDPACRQDRGLYALSPECRGKALHLQGKFALIDA